MSNRETNLNAAIQQLRVPAGAGLAFSTELPNFTLAPAEAALLSPGGAVSRREQFRLGRAAAHAALAKLGTPLEALGKLPSGAPAWPPGICGSISHTDRLGACVVGSTRDFQALGVDLHALDREIGPALVGRICTPTEQQWLLAAAERQWLSKALFSAKESLFKALHPLHGQFIGFTEANLIWHQERREFSGAVDKLGLSGFRITAESWRDLIVTLAVLPQH